MMLVPLFLPLLLLQLIIPMTSARLNSVKVIRYRESRKTRNGPVMCALDVANETMSSSSLQDCSYNCSRDVTCTGFNTKNSLICDVYNYKPTFTAPISACKFYQVCNISNLLFYQWCWSVPCWFYDISWYWYWPVEIFGPINVSASDFLSLRGKKITQHSGDERDTAFLSERVYALMQR